MKLLSLLTILFLSVSCTTAPKPPNPEVCGKLPRGNGGRCGFPLGGPKKTISEEKWEKWANSPIGMVCTTAKGWSEVTGYIRKTCPGDGPQCGGAIEETVSYIDGLDFVGPLKMVKSE